MNLEKLFNDIEALAVSNPQTDVHSAELAHVAHKLIAHAKSRTNDTVNEVVRAHFKLAKRLQGAATLIEMSSHTPLVRAVKLGPLRITITKKPETDCVIISWEAGDVIKRAVVSAKFELHDVDANDVLYAMHTPILWLPDQPTDIEVLIEADRNEPDRAHAKSFDFDELKDFFGGGTLVTTGQRTGGNETYEPAVESSADNPVSDNVEGVVVEWITNGVLVRGGSSEGTFCNYYESLETFVRDRLGAQAGRYIKHNNPQVGDTCILYFDLHDAAGS